MSAAQPTCAICGRIAFLGAGGCSRAWYERTSAAHGTSLRGPTPYDERDCERAERLAALARAEKAEARVAVLEAFVRAWDYGRGWPECRSARTEMAAQSMVAIRTARAAVG